MTVQELMFSGQIISARNFQYFTVYTVTALLYFAGLCYPSGLAVRVLEEHIRKGQRSRDDKKMQQAAASPTPTAA